MDDEERRPDRAYQAQLRQIISTLQDERDEGRAETRRLRDAVLFAQKWFEYHEYSGDGLTVVQRLREVSSTEEVAKARACEARVLADSIAAAKRAAEAAAIRNESFRRLLNDALRNTLQRFEAENSEGNAHAEHLCRQALAALADENGAVEAPQSQG